MLRPPVRNIQQKPPIIGYYEFSQEEIRTLQDCDKESFYGRCLPISTLFATLTYFAVKNEARRADRQMMDRVKLLRFLEYYGILKTEC